MAQIIEIAEEFSIIFKDILDILKLNSNILPWINRAGFKHGAALARSGIFLSAIISQTQ